MTKEEALFIPDLDIEVTPIIEDAFYFKKALVGDLSDDVGSKAVNRLQQEGYKEKEIYEALTVADKMIANQRKYGVACLEWMQ